MSHVQTFRVYPKVPEPLVFAEKMVNNLWWTWNLEAIELLRRIDPKLWNRSDRNPIKFFSMLSQKQLENIVQDESYMAHLQQVKKIYEECVEQHEAGANGKDYGKVAYFSMEYGIHESLPLFAGGLGMLAGDHLKAASDRDEPLVAVGLLYRRGYFHQYLDQNGWQQEEYPETDLYQLPVERAFDVKGNPIVVSILGPDGPIHAQVYKVLAGRIPLFLLDTNIWENSMEIRNLTSRLYIADGKIRLAQEIILGIGGLRALETMGIHPSVCHLNEGHCSFAILEWLAQIIRRHNIDLKTALEIIPRATVFTTHTPVAAGHDEFPVDLVRPYLNYYAHEFNVPVEEIISWGQMDKRNPHAPFSMFCLGLRMAQYCNGVSELHGHVARKMWVNVWASRPVDEIPIGHITNGVHIPSWISIENAMLLERYLAPNWYKTWKYRNIFDRIDDIYDEEIWRAHEMSRARLIRTCRSLIGSAVWTEKRPQGDNGRRSLCSRP